MLSKVNPFRRFIFLTGFCNILFAGGIENIHFEKFGSEQGLTQNTVFEVFHDSKGFLWFATDGGLLRYDGYNFTVYEYDPSDSTSIRQNFIFDIFEDSRHQLWLGMQDWLAKYDFKTDAFENYSIERYDDNSLPVRVMSIVEDTTGVLWIGTMDAGIYLIDKDGKSLTHISPEPEDDLTYGRTWLNKIYADKKGKIWIAKNNGLFTPEYSEDGKVTLSNLFTKENHYNKSVFGISSIIQDRDNEFWIATINHGLFRYDSLMRNYRQYKAGDINSISDNQVWKLAEDLEGNIWIANWSKGIDIYDKKRNKFINYRHNKNDPGSLPVERFSGIYVDSEGTVWITTEGYGVAKYSMYNNKFTHIYSYPGEKWLNNNQVFGIFEDDNGYIWATTSVGLSKYNRRNSSFINYEHDPGAENNLPGYNFVDVVQDQEDNFWISTWGYGVIRFNPVLNKATHYESDRNDTTSLPNEFVNTIYVDKSGVLWIACQEAGLSKYNKTQNNFTRLKNNSNKNNETGKYSILGISEDNRGNLILSTDGDGVKLFNPGLGKFADLILAKNNEASEYPDRIIYTIQDSQGNYWIGSLDNGIYKFDKTGKALGSITKRNGLSGNFITSIVEDDYGYIWISTRNGLSRLDTSTGFINNFTPADGAQAYHFHPLSAFKNKSGELFFGGINGFNIIDPENIKFNRKPPQIRFLEFRLQNKSVTAPGKHLSSSIPIAHEVNLTYFDNIFSIGFAAMSFVAPRQNRFAYKLEGFQEEWIYTDASNRQVTYTNLDPGTYTFRVKASNNDGIWNETGNSIRINIDPAYWQTWWFKSLLGFSFIGILLALYKRRTNTLKREREVERQFTEKLIEAQEKERKRIAGELHDSLGQNLLVIKNRTLMGKQFLTDKQKADEQLDEISHSVSHAIENVKHISQNLRPYQLDRLGLKDAIKSMIEKISDSTSIKFNVNIDDINDVFSKEAEINIFRITQESTNNILKHSQANKCKLNLILNNDLLDILIEDDGKGFEPYKSGQELQQFKGMGLMSLTERARILHGTIEINSFPGKGTKIKIVIPVNKNQKV